MAPNGGNQHTCNFPFVHEVKPNQNLDTYRAINQIIPLSKLNRSICLAHCKLDAHNFGLEIIVTKALNS